MVTESEQMAAVNTFFKIYKSRVMTSGKSVPTIQDIVNIITQRWTPPEEDP